MSDSHLNGHHRKTLASIFRHPASHNVEWHDVLSLLNNLGVVNDRHGGGVEITIGDDRLDLDRPHGKDLSEDELRDLAAFLTGAGLSPADLAPEAPTLVEVDRGDASCIVLIDHHQARLFGLGGEGSDPAVPRVLKPDDRDGTRRRLEHRQGNDDNDGGHSQEDDGWYERISVDLKTAGQIVVFSDGKGRSSAGAYLIDYLNRHYPGIGERVVAGERANISHLSDGEIVAAGAALLKAG